MSERKLVANLGDGGYFVFDDGTATILYRIVTMIDPNKVEFSIKVLPEEQSPDGFFASGDDEQDRQDVAWINNELYRGNQWAWCVVVVTGKYGPLTAKYSLGGCSYRDEADFISGGYYDDMKHAVVEELESQLETLANM